LIAVIGIGASWSNSAKSVYIPATDSFFVAFVLNTVDLTRMLPVGSTTCCFWFCFYCFESLRAARLDWFWARRRPACWF